jgi:hypothetical protein
LTLDNGRSDVESGRSGVAETECPREVRWSAKRKADAVVRLFGVRASTN